MIRAKLLTEFVGTFGFFSIIALSHEAGQLAPVAIGFGLAAMVYMGGHISGAHYNPAVSFGLFLRGVMTPLELGLYWFTQLLAGSLAFVLADQLSGITPGIHPGHGVLWYWALTAEVLFSAALVLVVLNVAATKETAGNSYYGIAIGFTVGAGVLVVGPISGAAFNPAVGFAATLGGAMFANGTWSDLWIYIVGPLAGAAIATFIHRQQSRPQPIPPERSERLE